MFFLCLFYNNHFDCDMIENCLLVEQINFIDKYNDTIRVITQIVFLHAYCSKKYLWLRRIDGNLNCFEFVSVGHLSTVII